jgi:hypothetical protein
VLEAHSWMSRHVFSNIPATTDEDPTMTTRNEDDDDENDGKYCALLCLISTYCIILNLTHTVFSSISHDSARPITAAIGIPMMAPSSSEFRVSPHQLAPQTACLAVFTQKLG